MGAYPAHRASLLIDADSYYSRLYAALQKAERSIIILGWDFDAGISLSPDKPDCPPLGKLLRGLVEAKPELEIRILVWNLSTIHAPGQSLPLILGADWQRHPRIHLLLDHRHPIYGAQHQKVVCIDDSLAFVGGIDLTVERWDTSEHRPNDDRRRDRDGELYRALHDGQMMVEGEAAEAVAAVAHHRWRQATEEPLTLKPASKSLWPTDLEPDFVDVPVAISRTIPASHGEPEIREIAALTDDALKAAENSIYIEAQYLANARVGDILEKHLQREDGPEIVVVTPHTSKGVLEKWTMGNNRDRMIRRLKRADRYGRYRAYYPAIQDGERLYDIFVHAKLMIVDDRFLRIGSANLNRRSTGLDTECDLSIDATDLGDEVRQTIAAIRARLLAEHLGVAADEVTAATESEGGMIGAIERLNTHARQLRPFDHIGLDGPVRLMPGTRILDPSKPLPLLSLFRRKRPRRDTAEPGSIRRAAS
jgi:phosphatidylserine/phosphatidylglycerophosphate/cardiolipin synthase-like enzyme